MKRTEAIEIAISYIENMIDKRQCDNPKLDKAQKGLLEVIQKRDKEVLKTLKVIYKDMK